MKEPKVGKGEPPHTPICNLNITLPDYVPVSVFAIKYMSVFVIQFEFDTCSFTQK